MCISIITILTVLISIGNTYSGDSEATHSLTSVNYTGQVHGITPGGTIIYFNVDGATYAGCAIYNRYVLDTKTQFGKNSYALILAASLAGKSVGVTPMGACNTMPNDAEDLFNVTLP
jgi:hypothetical protein